MSETHETLTFFTQGWQNYQNQLSAALARLTPEQLALRAVGKNVDEIERELFEIVVNHHQVAVLALQFFLVRFDLHLSLALGLRCALLVHCVKLL